MTVRRKQLDHTIMTPAEVRAIRKKLGLTQVGLAAAIGRASSVRAIKYWEGDTAPPGQRIPPDAALLLRYMAKFGLPDAALDKG